MLNHVDRETLAEAMRAPFPHPDHHSATLYQMIEYHLGWRNENLQPQEADSGKLIRPNLCLLACKAVGGDTKRALPLAAAVQLIHDFSLVHDDIQDHSELRRGRTTVWRLWGEAQGINVGDALCILSHLVLLRLADVGLSAEQTLAIVRRFDASILRICEGQYLDLSFEERLDLREDEYLAMIERKTATLIAAALHLGALAGGDAQAAVTLGDYGLALGMAFQIQDDILGIWGDPAVTGKPLAADLYRRKKSLPIVYALAHAPPHSLEQLRSIYRQTEVTSRHVATLLEILEHSGARHYAEEMAAGYHTAALAALDRVPAANLEVLSELRALAESLLRRSK